MDVAALADLSTVYLAGNPKQPGKRGSNAQGDACVLKAEPHVDKPKTPKDEVNEKLVEAIMEYNGEKAIEWTKNGLAIGMTPQEIVFVGLPLVMKAVGVMYQRNECFVTD